MRKWYLLPLVLIVGDLAVFWVLKQFGVLRLGHIPPNWVKTAFLLPLDIAWMAGLFAVIRGAVQGVAYSSLGGSEIKCSNEPLRFVFNVMAHSLVFGFGIVAFTWLMFVHAD
jgi:hypothetical protein